MSSSALEDFISAISTAREAANRAIASYEPLFQEVVSSNEQEEDWQRALSLKVAQVDDEFRWCILEALSYAVSDVEKKLKTDPTSALAQIHQDYRDAIDRKYEELEADV